MTMIDDDDVDFAILASNPTTGFGLVIVIAVVAVLAYMAHTNKVECSARHCDTGHPALIKGECLCAETAR
jgi:hypothetical protein